jgi:uncharacterized protein DUF397
MAQSMGDAPDKGEIIALSWRKSARSIGNGQCVEAAGLADGRLVMRDSADRSGPVLSFGRSEWHAFVRGVKRGKFDSL